MITTVVLVRHAQTDSNIAGPNPRMSGWTDLPVNGCGVEQIALLGQRFQREPRPAAVYSSPLLRARQTAAAVAQAAGLPIRLLADLREIDCGEVDGEPIAIVRETYAPLWTRNMRQDDDEFRWPGGESYGELRVRCLRALATIAAAHAGERVAVVTHAGVITQVLGALHGRRPANWEAFRVENTSLTELRIDGARQELTYFNDRRHLATLRAA